jgi:5-methylcytosine-specific restriction enzyme subunit McrC
VSPQPLKRSLLQQVQREASRLTHAYRPALSLVALLLQSASVSPAGTGERVTVSGFLFDMNLFWQELMERFLTEYLVGARVESQYHLRGLLTYLQGFNPRNRPAPVPRPDYVITQKGRVTAILDAKYRDLWERTLPRDMMYQLLVYALSHRGCTEATMLYPTTAESAREAKIELRDPIRGSGRATVVLRPVFLPYLPTLLSDRRTSAGQQRCADYAHYLAFGKSETRPSLL